MSLASSPTSSPSEGLLSKEDIEGLVARCFHSEVEFCRVFLADWFPAKMPWVHRGILALIRGRGDFLLDFGPESWRDEEAEWTEEDLEKVLTNFIDERTQEPIFTLHHKVDGSFEIRIKSRRSIVIIMPRGFSKTSLLNANTVWECCYQVNDFFLYLSEASDHAERQLDTVKGVFEENELVRLCFGDKVPPRQSNLKWAVNYIETQEIDPRTGKHNPKKSVQVGALGTGGKVRGFSKRSKRPRLLLFDDLQDEKSVESDAQLRTDKRWFLRAARPAKAKGGRDIMLGTLLHEEACLNVAVRSSAFTAVRFGAVDRQGDALWSFMLSLEELETLKQEAAENGELPGFYMEYMSEFRSDEVAMFPESKMIYVHRGLEWFPVVGLALDPAISKSKRAAEAAMAAVGMEAGGRKHVIDYHGQKGMDPDEMQEKYFEFYWKYLSHLPPENAFAGIEAVQFQAALLYSMRTLMAQKSKTLGMKAFFEIKPIYHGQTQKESRIKAILKRPIWAGMLTFESTTRSAKLHSQFIRFGQGGLVDGPDAVAMACALIDPAVLLELEAEGQPASVFMNDNFEPSVESMIGGDFRSAP